MGQATAGAAASAAAGPAPARLASWLIGQLHWMVPQGDQPVRSEHDKATDAAAISYHYDLSNDFYGLWLDRELIYSCAYYENGDEDLDQAQRAKLRHLCRKLRLQGVESVAISLLFSFINPDHEKRVKAIVAQEMQDVHISAGHEVLPRAPEYDRTSTTVVNAYVGPRVTSYLERLVTRLRDGGYKNQLMVMQASGGVMTKQYIDGAPIRVLASGPAGGVIGSAHAGRAKGHPDLLCVDMGGTSYDMSVVIGGQAPAEAGWNMHHRYLIGVPMVKVETLGAGGGFGDIVLPL